MPTDDGVLLSRDLDVLVVTVIDQDARSLGGFDQGISDFRGLPLTSQRLDNELGRTVAFWVFAFRPFMQ